MYVHTYVGVPTEARKGGPEPLKLDLQVVVLGTPTLVFGESSECS